MATSRGVEALAEAIIAYSGYLDPESSLYRARNPGGLPATSFKHKRDEEGNRIFKSLIDGIQALLYDVDLKLSGKSRNGLSRESTLTDFAIAFGCNKLHAMAWAKFLSKALQDNITHATRLERFLE